MTKTYSISGMTCTGCAATVEKALSSVHNISGVKVNLEGAKAEITMTAPIVVDQLQEALKPYPSYQLSENGHAHPSKPVGFWSDGKVWGRASLNTLNCLIGCSLGDFGMIIFLQAWFPATSMFWQMILATGAGLATSVMFESTLLHWRENFNWKLAFQTAVSMSFISMVAMEVVMNATDFMVTGGKAAFGNPLYWTALLIAMVAGFITPLPYNYYRLKKYNQACH